MIDHNIKIIGVSFVKSIINMVLMFRFVECSFIIEYFFIIFISAGIFLITLNAFESNKIITGILLGISFLMYILPYRIPIAVYISVDSALMWILPDITGYITEFPENIPDLLPKEYDNIEKENNIKNDIMEMHSDGYKQSEIAKQLGVTQGYVSRVINEDKK